MINAEKSSRSEYSGSTGLKINVRPCRLCGGNDSRLLFRAPGFDDSQELFQLVICRRCDVALTQPVPDMTSLDRYYSNGYYGSERRKFVGVIEKVIDHFTSLRANKIANNLAKSKVNNLPHKILDVGCGRAKLLLKFKEMGFDCHGIERDGFPDDQVQKGLNLYRHSLTTLNFSPDSFDAIVIWHVLEHLHDPFETIDEAIRILKPGGVVVIAVPNFTSFQACLFKSNWFHLDLPRHLYHFGTENLKKLLVDRRLAIRSSTTFSFEQNIFGFIQSVFNCLSLGVHPNEFYRLIKSNNVDFRLIKSLPWLLASALILPFALTEYFISGILGLGASVTVIASKN